MKEILLRSHEVIGFQSGRKTLLARPVLPEPGWCCNPVEFDNAKGWWTCHEECDYRCCPFGVPGDVLWCRETFFVDHVDADITSATNLESLVDDNLYYRADGECCKQIPDCACAEVGRPRWRPGTQMPQWASRLSLSVESTSVKRVHELTDAEVVALGIEKHEIDKYRKFFHKNDVHCLAFRDQWDADWKQSPLDQNGHCWLARVSVQKGE